MNFLYSLSKIEYSYSWNKQKVSVLKGIDLQIPAESFCCLVGPSGVGKTTLLNIMGLVDAPSEGQLLFENQNLGALSEGEKEIFRLKNIGFIFQSFYLLPTLSVLENASYFLPLLGVSPKQAKESVIEVLDLLGLADHLHKKPLELSGGQRQRVAIARAIVKKPKVILADEPTANLDSQTADRIIKVFQQLQKTEKTSFIFSTHDEHLVSYAKVIYKMKDGLILKKSEVP